MCTQKTFRLVTHPKISLGQACLTWMFFRGKLPKKKMHLIGMGTLLILLSFGPGYHHPPGQDIIIHPLEKMNFVRSFFICRVLV
jgi:hypothetical protein